MIFTCGGYVFFGMRGEKVKQIFDEIGGTVVYVLAGGGVLGMFLLLLERLLA